MWSLVLKMGESWWLKIFLKLFYMLGETEIKQY